MRGEMKKIILRLLKNIWSFLFEQKHELDFERFTKIESKPARKRKVHEND